jgi:hypothetical protein
MLKAAGAGAEGGAGDEEVPELEGGDFEAAASK